MAKEYLAAKHPGGRRIHIWDDDASFDEYRYDREEVIHDKYPPNHKVGTTKDGFVIYSDGVVYNDELGIYDEGGV